MAVQGALGEVKPNMATTRTTFLGLDQWQVHPIRDKVRLEKQSLLLAFPCKEFWVPIEAFWEVILGVEDETRVPISVQDWRRVGYCDVPGGFRSRQVEVLVDGIQWYREQCPGSPLKLYLLPGEVFDCRLSVARKDHHGLFE